MIYVPYDFKYNCGENKGRKKITCVSALYDCCFDEQAFSVQMKEMCHPFFEILHAFITLFVPQRLFFFLFTHSASEVVFKGHRATLCLFVCLLLSFFIFPFVIVLIQNLKPGLCLCSHLKILHQEAGGLRDGLHILLPFKGLKLSKTGKLLI